MANYWFTADQHFDHFNAIGHANRPYRTLEEMNESLIEIFNSLVGKRDHTYHMGDFAWKRPGHFLQRLNGHHYLIRGNHDRSVGQMEKAGFKWVKDTAMINIDKQYIWLSHYPHRSWNRGHYGVYHLYGHCHGGLTGYWGRSMDVGVDAWAYRPINFETIRAVLEPREVMAEVKSWQMERDQNQVIIENLRL